MFVFAFRRLSGKQKKRTKLCVLGVFAVNKDGAIGCHKMM